MQVKSRDTEQLNFLICSFLYRNENKMIPKSRIIGILGITIESARSHISSLVEIGFITYDYVGEHERYYPHKVLSLTDKGRKFVELYKNLWDLMPKGLKSENDMELELNCQDPFPDGMFLK
jgi:predicted transcriptional regulator